MGILEKGERKYEVTQNDKAFIFKDISDRKFKFNFTMSKCPEKNKYAEEGLKTFFTEIYS
jgi:hypothetical protein